MSKPQELKKMQDYTCSILDATGEFSIIDPHYNFNHKKSSKALKQKSNKQIYCVKKPEYSRNQQPEEFLILTHADEKMPGALFANKIIEASDLGIHTTNLLYRYINSTNPDTQGPLFRRFILDQERKAGPVAYRKRASFNNPLLDHYTNQQKNAFRILKNIEKLVNASSNFFPAYYQPESARLEEMLKLYKFQKVHPWGRDSKGNFHSKDYIRTINPELIESSEFFSLEPMRRKGTKSYIVKNLENNIKPKIIFPRDKKILLADFLPLPNIQDLQNPILRHNIALLAYTQENGLKELYEEMIERTCIQAENLNDNHPLVQSLDTILTGKIEQQDPLKLREIKTIRMPSNTHPGLYHNVLISKNLNSDKSNYICSCKGYKFSKKEDKHCRHTDELKKLDEFYPEN